MQSALLSVQEEHQARTSAKILEQSLGAGNRVGIGLTYRPARLHRLVESFPWNRFLGSTKVNKFGLWLTPEEAASTAKTPRGASQQGSSPPAVKAANSESGSWSRNRSWSRSRNWSRNAVGERAKGDENSEDDKNLHIRFSGVQGTWSKGTVSRDFRLLFFFMNQFPPSLWVYH